MIRRIIFLLTFAFLIVSFVTKVNAAEKVEFNPIYQFQNFTGQVLEKLEGERRKTEKDIKKGETIPQIEKSLKTIEKNVPIIKIRRDKIPSWKTPYLWLLNTLLHIF